MTFFHGKIWRCEVQLLYCEKFCWQLLPCIALSSFKSPWILNAATWHHGCLYGYNMLQHFTMTYDVDMPRARWCFWIGFVSVVMISSQEWSREARVSKPWVSTLPTFTMEPVKLVPTGLIWLAMAPLLVSVSTSWATRLYHLNQASAAQLVLNHIILWHVEDGLIQPLCWDASRISESGLCIKLWSNPGWKIPYIQYV